MRFLVRTQIHHTQEGFSGQVISPSETPLLGSTQHSRKTSTHPVGFEPTTPREIVDPRLRPHDVRNEQKLKETFVNLQNLAFCSWPDLVLNLASLMCACACFCANRRRYMKIMIAGARMQHIKTAALPTTATAL